MKTKGFSLVEVLVALLVIGVALPALLGQMMNQSDSQLRLRNKTLALYVAQNKMAETRIAKIQGQGKLPNSSSGEIEMAGARWFWRIEASDTQLPKLQRVIVSVGLDQEEDLTQLEAVMSE